MALGTATGYSGIMGAAKETAFRTPVNINTRIPITAEGLSDAIKLIEQETLMGYPGRDTLDAGPISVTGSVDTEVRFATANSGRTIFFGNDLLVALAMGACAWHAGSSTNILKLSDDLDKSATLALHKKIAIWEFVSCFFKGFKFSGKAGEIWKTSFDTVAYKLMRGDPSSGSQQNKQAQFNALSVTAGKRGLFGDSTFILAPVNTAWGGGESNFRIGLNEFSLNYESGLTDPEFSTPDAAGGHTDANLTIQPVRGGFRKCELEFSLPRYQDLSGGALQWGSQLLAWKDTQAPLQLLGTIQPSGDSTRIIKAMCPYLVITAVDAAISGPAPASMKVKATLLRGAGRNTVVTDAAGSSIAEEFQLEFKNSNNAASEYGRNAAIF
ncbi:hypothetical protein KKH18_07015 [bacterium]|nr:hypothetical protein [bacterium]